MVSDPEFTPAQREATFALGLFVEAWSVMEAHLEYAIAEQLGLQPLEGSIVTAGLAFKAKATMLKTLLNRDPVKNAEAIKALTALMNKSDRNDLMHSVAGSNAEGLVFTRRKSDGQFKSTEKEHTKVTLATLSLEIARWTAEFTQALGLTTEGYEAYFDSAHKAANKA